MMASSQIHHWRWPWRNSPQCREGDTHFPHIPWTRNRTPQSSLKSLGFIIPHWSLQWELFQGYQRTQQLQSNWQREGQNRVKILLFFTKWLAWVVTVPSVTGLAKALTQKLLNTFFLSKMNQKTVTRQITWTARGSQTPNKETSACTTTASTTHAGEFYTSILQQDSRKAPALTGFHNTNQNIQWS